MLHFISQDAEDQGLDFRQGFSAGRTVGEGTGNAGHLRQPAAVQLLFDFNLHEGRFGESGIFGKGHSGEVQRGNKTMGQAPWRWKGNLGVDRAFLCTPQRSSLQ